LYLSELPRIHARHLPPYIHLSDSSGLGASANSAWRISGFAIPRNWATDTLDLSIIRFSMILEAVDYIGYAVACSTRKKNSTDLHAPKCGAVLTPACLGYFLQILTLSNPSFIFFSQ
jgi:hypothetical protein